MKKEEQILKIAMIYMASGFGRRYGVNKLLELMEGEPLYLHGLHTLLETKEKLAAADVEVIVVSQYAEVLAKAKTLGVKSVYNPHSQEGITASIHLGIRMAPDADAYLFAVADQPWLKADSVLHLIAEFCGGEKTIACLTDGTQNGNPVIFTKKYKEELLALTGDKGGSVIMKRYPEEIRKVLVEKKELQDIDVPLFLSTKIDIPYHMMVKYNYSQHLRVGC